MAPAYREIAVRRAIFSTAWPEGNGAPADRGVPSRGVARQPAVDSISRSIYMKYAFIDI